MDFEVIMVSIYDILLHVFILYMCTAKQKVEFSEEVQVKTIKAPEQLIIDEVKMAKIEIP
jgi:hypothetical protein